MPGNRYSMGSSTVTMLTPRSLSRRAIAVRSGDARDRRGSDETIRAEWTLDVRDQRAAQRPCVPRRRTVEQRSVWSSRSKLGAQLDLRAEERQRRRAIDLERNPARV